MIEQYDCYLAIYLKLAVIDFPILFYSSFTFTSQLSLFYLFIKFIYEVFNLISSLFIVTVSFFPIFPWLAFVTTAYIFIVLIIFAKLEPDQSALFHILDYVVSYYLGVLCSIVLKNSLRFYINYVIIIYSYCHGPVHKFTKNTPKYQYLCINLRLYKQSKIEEYELIWIFVYWC